MPIAYMQQWIESEAGFGQSDDGMSLHLTPAHARDFLVEYTSQRTGPKPESYDRPSGDVLAVEVSDDVHQKLVDGGGNLRTWDMVLEPSPTGARTVVAKSRFDGETFVDKLMAKTVELKDLDTFVAQWHNGAAPGSQLHDYLGVTFAQYSRIVRNPEVLLQIAFERAIERLKPTLQTHRKSLGHYLVIGEGVMERDKEPVTVYMGVDGQIWVRNAREFNDGRFAVRQAAGSPTFSVAFSGQQVT